MLARWFSSRLTASLVAVTLSLSVGSTARASCSTSYCLERSRQWAAAQESEAEAAIAADPADREAWHRLLSRLRDKPDRVRRSAAYRSRLDWEPQPALEDPDLEARLLEERLAWLSAYRETFADEGETLCPWADAHPHREEALRVLAEVQARRADDAALARCLVGNLRAAGREAEALARARAFRARHGDLPEAYAIVAAASGRPEAKRDALAARASRFPDCRSFRLELLYHLSQHQIAPDLDVVLAELVASAETAEELHETCISVQGDRRRWCYEEMVRRSAARGLEVDVGGAHQELLGDALRRDDRAEVDRLLASWPERSLLYAWSILPTREGDERTCSRFLESFHGGAFEAALADPEDAAGNAVRLAALLESCGAPEPAAALRSRAAPHLSDFQVRASDGPEVLAEAWRRLEADPGSGYWRGAVMGHLERLPPERRVPELERLADLLPGAEWPAVHLAETLEELGDVDGALTWLGVAAERKGGDVDLSLRRATLALRHGRNGAATAIARTVLRRDGSARQHADARYVLGRVARREGRWDEASEHLTHYFLRRLRHQGCTAWHQCDLSLVFHLLEAHDRRRLEDYLERRDEAIAGFVRTVGYDGHRRRPRLFEDDEYLQVAVRYLGCVAPGALAYLEERAAAEPDDTDLRERLAEARAEPACEGELRSGSLVDDDLVLSLERTLTEVR